MRLPVEPPPPPAVPARPTLSSWRSLPPLPRVLYAPRDCVPGLVSGGGGVRGGCLRATSPEVAAATAATELRTSVAGTVFDRVSGRGLHPGVLARLPVVTRGGEGGESCVVCLEVEAEGDLVRVLPCGHEVHQRCVDVWLLADARCPLCLAVVA